MKRLRYVAAVATTIACSSSGDLADKKAVSNAASGGGRGGADGAGGAPVKAPGGMTNEEGGEMSASGGATSPSVYPSKGPPPFQSGGAGGGLAGGDSGGTAGDMATGASAGGVGGAPPEASCDRISTAPGDFNPCGSGIDTIAYSPDGAFLAIGNEANAPNVHVYRMSDGALIHALDGVGDRAMSVAFSPDGAILAVSGESPGGGMGVNEPDIVKLYDSKSGAELRSLPVSCGSYSDSVAFSSDGALLATAGASGNVEVWRVSDGTRVTQIPYAASVHNVHFGPTDSEIIVGGYDARATVWSVPDGKKLLELAPTTDEMSDAAFAPDGSQIATTGPDNDVQIWDASSGELLQRIASHQAYVSHVIWFDQNHLISDDWSGVITWMKRQPSGDFAVTSNWPPDAGGGIAVSPDKKVLAASTAQSGAPGFEFFAIDAAQL